MDLDLIASGKVREVYAIRDDPTQLLMVATDRISAYDRVFDEPVIDKGRLLSAISATAFAAIRSRFRTHFVGVVTDVSEEFLGRATLVERANMVPVECVARGYLVGSAYEMYRRTGEVQGVRLPAGLSFGDELTEPIFTPTTKESTGHDRPLTGAELRNLHGSELASQLEERTKEIYLTLAAWFRDHHLTLVDSKFEFGFIGDELALADEIATPDSSRIVRGQPGVDPMWLDKQLLRDWLSKQGFRGDGAAPTLDDAIVERVRSAYVEVYESLSGQLFTAWPGVSRGYRGSDVS
ncbi:MAG: phosphoribosylaminoimidazolesuccinocarboxamide synthase [Ferrimicrobium sp.]|jgi:phosphoribosylaminoimidazole-succinocarboxamide synthase|nr:phosphoribosylaminoimidazolesuccinocarboxamide synthase [Ferrimicrobium sp.]